jgi:hypothetical protein
MKQKIIQLSQNHVAAVPSPRFQREPVNWRANKKSSGAHPPKKTGRAVRVTTPVPATSPAFPVIAQDRPTSENFSRPETSIKTGDVDYILPLDEIAPTLTALVWAGKKPKGRRPAAPAPAKCATPGYAAGGKAVMLKPSHQSA